MPFIGVNRSKNDIIRAFAHLRNHSESQRMPTSHPKPLHMPNQNKNARSGCGAMYKLFSSFFFIAPRLNPSSCHDLPRIFLHRATTKSFIAPRPIRQQTHLRPFSALRFKMNGGDEPRNTRALLFEEGARN